MAQSELGDVAWYHDMVGKRRGEPGILFSFMGALASALDYAGRPVDPAWLMGASAFAFRLWVNKVMCPSAMSVFDWSSLLPEAIEQAGYYCSYVSRYWHEGEFERERRELAHSEIIRGIERGMPAIAWDVDIPEWGLVTGYDDATQTYATLSCQGRVSRMPYHELGHREIKILSVAIPGEPNGRPRRDVILNSLRAAVRHADQQEWMQRPDYQDGLPAYDLWSAIVDSDDPAISFDFSRYYAGHWFGARCYARDYLAAICEDDTNLLAALVAYGRVAECLAPVWQTFSNDGKPLSEVRRELAERIRGAKAEEERGIQSLRRYVETQR